MNVYRMQRVVGAEVDERKELEAFSLLVRAERGRRHGWLVVRSLVVLVLLASAVPEALSGEGADRAVSVLTIAWSAILLADAGRYLSSLRRGRRLAAEARSRRLPIDVTAPDVRAS